VVPGFSKFDPRFDPRAYVRVGFWASSVERGDQLIIGRCLLPIPETSSCLPVRSLRATRALRQDASRDHALDTIAV
jgi:hypothetical protein